MEEPREVPREKLLDAIVDFAALVSPDKVKEVASGLRGLASPTLAQAAIKLAGHEAGCREAFRRVLEEWSKTTLSDAEVVSGAEVAGMLLGAKSDRLRLEKELGVELVWTGPKVKSVSPRHTERVLCELIDDARTELFLVSFVAYEVPNVVKAMNEATHRGVRVRVLLEASASHGGTLKTDLAEAMRARVPGVELFTWKKKSDEFRDGKVHAKVALADGKRAFLTSANLTMYAFEKNMELGVLIHGGRIPEMLRELFEQLLVNQDLVPV